jgi:hypothetical protein
VSHTYFSHRTGVNPNIKGLGLFDVINLFVRVFSQLEQDGYFQEAFGYFCIDAEDNYVNGKVSDIPLEILLDIRKKNLWPIDRESLHYSEDDLFDIIEFLYQHISKPLEGSYHSYSNCGMHYETFDQKLGQIEFCQKVNSILEHYVDKFELSSDGEILHKPEDGLEPIIKAKIPSDDSNVIDRINAAKLLYQRHKSSIVDRRHAVSELTHVLEYLRPKMQSVLDKKDEADLFNIANNFGIRHHNDKQKTDFDEPLWLGWMFYFYLTTIHVVLRKINSEQPSQNAQK